MNKFLFVSATVVASLFAFDTAIASAADKKEGAESKARSVEEQMDNLVKLDGVQNVKTDDTGRVLRLVVIGHARVSNIFGAAKGKEMARKNARRAAEAQFAKWLKTKVEVHESKEEGEAILMVGDKDADKRSETGKAIETSSDTFKSVAAGLVRGLEVVHADLNPDGEEFTVICGWKAANSKAAKDVATNDPGIDDKSAAGADTKKESGSAEPKKKHHREKATSSNAEDYLK
jgi:hypothetical protein